MSQSLAQCLYGADTLCWNLTANDRRSTPSLIWPLPLHPLCSHSVRFQISCTPNTNNSSCLPVHKKKKHLVETFFGKASLSPSPSLPIPLNVGDGGEQNKTQRKKKRLAFAQADPHPHCHTHSHTQNKQAVTPPLLSTHCNNFGWTGQRVGRLRWNTQKRRGSV